MYMYITVHLLVKKLPSMILLVDTSNFPSLAEPPVIIQEQILLFYSR